MSLFKSKKTCQARKLGFQCFVHIAQGVPISLKSNFFPPIKRIKTDNMIGRIGDTNEAAV